jgi:ABC-2 type transport system ATP-binding protein
MEIAERICNRVGIIDRGRLIACGTIDELKVLSQKDMASLEDLFLQLTGGTAYAEVVRSLEEGVLP